MWAINTVNLLPVTSPATLLCAQVHKSKQEEKYILVFLQLYIIDVWIKIDKS